MKKICICLLVLFMLHVQLNTAFADWYRVYLQSRETIGFRHAKADSLFTFPSGYNGPLVNTVIVKDSIYKINDRSLAAYDVRSKRELWRFSFKENIPHRCLVLHEYFILYNDNKIFVINSGDGVMRREILKKEYEVWSESLERVSKVLYLIHRGSNSFSIKAIDMQSGKEIWKKRYIGSVTEYRPHALIGNTVIRFSDSKALWVIDPESGNKKFEVKGSIGSVNKKNDVLVIKKVDYDQHGKYKGIMLTGIDRIQGKTLWERKGFPYIIMNSSSSNGVAVLSDASVYFIDAASGSDILKPITLQQYGSGRIVSVDMDAAGSFLFGKAKNRIFKIDAVNGRLAWTTPTSWNSVPHVDSLYLYDIVPSEKGMHLLQYDLKSGSLENTYKIYTSDTPFRNVLTDCHAFLKIMDVGDGFVDLLYSCDRVE